MTTSDKPNLPNDVTSEVVSNNESATITISVSTPYTLLENKYDKAFAELSSQLKADGFRPGKVPADIAKKQIPEIMVLDRAGRDVIADLYLPLLQTHEVDGIGEPKITVKKLAKGNPFEFDITLAKMPEVDLGDYQKIKADADTSTIDPDVTDEELDQAIEALRQQWARQEKYQQLVADNPDSAKSTDPRQIKVEDDELPPIDDEWVEQLGDYQNVADFKTKFKTNIKTNKAMQELDRRRSELLGQIIESAEFSVPEIVYQAELDRLVELRKSEIKQAGLKFNEYLKAINQTEADMRTSMYDEAKNRIHTQMVIANIATNEDLKVDPEIVTKEVEHLQKIYPDAPQANLVAYVESQLTSNEVMKWLASPDKIKQPNTESKKKPAKKDSTKSKTKTDSKKKGSDSSK